MNDLTISYILFSIATIIQLVSMLYRPNKIVGLSTFIIWIFIALVTLANYVVWELTGTGYNESIAYHVQFGIDGSSIGDFNKMIVNVIISLMLLCISVLVYAKYFFKTQAQTNYLFVTPLLQIILLCYHPLITQIWNSNKTPENSSESFKKYFADPIQISGLVKGYNIVWIYAESFERTYLNDSLFPNLAPEIKKIEQQSLSFTNVQQVYGSSWTIAGIVASQCGMPLATMGLNGNKMDQMIDFLPGATGLSDLLYASDYNLVFLQGSDAAFAGTNKFMATHKFKLKSLINLLVKNTDNVGWGITDDKLLNVARNEYNKLNAGDKPFALMLSTINTHHPNGYVPLSCNNMIYKDGKNLMLNSVKCCDSLIGSFVSDIRKADINNNTLIIISSDHLAMKNSVYSLLNSVKRRNLLLFNFPGKIAPEKSDRPACMFDAGVTALNLCGFPITEIGLGRSLISKEKTFIEFFPETHNQILKEWSKEFNSFWYPKN